MGCWLLFGMSLLIKQEMHYGSAGVIAASGQTYADGTRIEKKFPYSEDGNYNKECEKQYELEEWPIGQHDDCVFYSVSYEEAAE